MKIRFVFSLLSLWVFGALHAQQLKPIELDATYEHDKYNTQPKDVVRTFRAYTVSFDGSDDDNGDGQADYWRVPEWVSYEIKAMIDPEKGPKRPSKWMTDKELHGEGVCATDAAYNYSQEFRKTHPNWYARGHMCMKLIAWRHGANADWNTHTLLNACPQREHNNAGIWLDMEKKTIAWANEFGSVWVICGPVFTDQTPSSFIGEPEKGELMVAVPDAFFKVVVREGPTAEHPEVLAFIYPQDTQRKDTDHGKYLVSVDEVEERTGLDLFTNLSPEGQQKIEGSIAKGIW